ncbi:MAG: hypothetical protein JKY65_00130 [Planctomycetes bacterium]|nr:hypothetical protein [Planctomycetota bacterium]
MTHPSLALLVLASLLSPTTLVSAEQYDLTKLLGREPKTGEVVREVSSEVEKGRQVIRRGGKVVQDQASSKSQAYTRLVQVLKADAAGDALKTRYTYVSYEREQGETKRVLEVEGLVVVVDQSQQEVTVSAEGKREINPFLENHLKDEAADQPKLAERIKQLSAFLPDKPVGLNETWTGKPVEVAKALGLSHEGINTKSSRVKGSLTAGKVKGTLRVLIKVQLTYTTYQSMKCKEPMQVEVTIEAIVPLKAGDPTGVMNQTMVMGGVLETQGMLVAIDLEQSSKTEITHAKK